MENRYKIAVGSDQSVILELLVAKKKRYARYILLTTASVIFLIPVIIILVLFLPSGEPLQFGILFSFIISWLCGGYLFRLYLWNTYGREVYVFGTRKLTYYANYRLMKDRYKEWSYSKIDIYYLSNNEVFPISCLQNESVEYLHQTQSSVCFILNGEEIVVSHIQLSLAEVIDIYSQCIPSLYNKRWIAN
ncbi:hypothetical protein JGH11_13395 [Dysgonomonas sp. Marseille-P4677]|uniref:hypothetical protein n=1 Tax=Dysgonomonas sp. Marseille-P4677 TaxID=2364790 RepID=UPI0019119841|nr:hypothetical protein [Dysgonomonas sp. Marseille-P4677]MBK5721869.1 hypothetical protein [Dysgonomonas sp. Marseille-P4677]